MGKSLLSCFFDSRCNIAVSFDRYSAHLYIEAAYRRPTNASAILRVSQRDVISIHHIDSDATAAAAVDILDGWILSPPTAMYASSSSSSTVSYAPIRVYIIMPRLQTELLSRLQAAIGSSHSNAPITLPLGAS